MTETIAVMFIFFILLSLGIVFYAKYSQGQAKAAEHERFGQKAMDMTLQTVFLPELICTNAEAETGSNCMDLQKLQYIDANKGLSGDEYYFSIFSYSKIWVEQLSPTEVSYIIYNNPKPESEYLEIIPSFFVVTLKDYLGTYSGKSDYNYGVLHVEVYR